MSAWGKGGVKRVDYDTDVLVIGGGANGTGLARDLAKRGLRVILCDKGDLARGATGASSAMIHGGPRYLLHDAATTKHSCADSGYIQKIAPHLLFRVPFLIPVPRKTRLGRAALLLHDVYFDVYDRYTPLKNGLPHACMSEAELRAVEPGLVGDFLGAITTDEWGTDPGRLCVLNALDAQAHGAQIRTYTEVVGVLRENQVDVCGVRVRRMGHAETEEIRARAVVNCAGPWAEQLAGMVGGGVRLRPGKGVHLIYERRLTNFAVATHAIDGRQVFIMPYQNETWLGTTDDDYYGDLDDLWASGDDIAYLKQAFSQLLPALGQQRLIGTRTGVRNTIHAWGVGEDHLSRRFEVVHHAKTGGRGFFSLAGGKLASFRLQAEELADTVCGHLKIQASCRTHLDPLPGGEEVPDAALLAQVYRISEQAARRIVSRHGALAVRVLEIGRETSTGFAVVDPFEPVLACEVRYCVRHELVGLLGDLLTRCRVGMGSDMGLHSALRVAQLFAEERGLDVTGEREALSDLLTRRWRSARPILAGAQLAQAELLLAQYADLWKMPPGVPL